MSYYEERQKGEATLGMMFALVTILGGIIKIIHSVIFEEEKYKQSQKSVGIAIVVCGVLVLLVSGLAYRFL